MHTRIFLLFFLFNYLFMSTKWIYPGCWMDPYDVCFSVMLGWSSNFVFVHGRLVLTLILNFRSFISDWNMEFFNEMSLKLETSYFKHNILVPSSSFNALWNSWNNKFTLSLFLRDHLMRQSFHPKIFSSTLKTPTCPYPLTLFLFIKKHYHDCIEASLSHLNKLLLQVIK